MPRELLQTILFLALCSCGGGGGGVEGPALVPAARLELSDGSLGTGVLTVALSLTLLETPRPAALVQFDLAMDGLRLRPASSRPVLESVQAVPTADSQTLEGGALRVLFGDGRNRLAQELREGTLLRLHLEPIEPRKLGPLIVVLRDLLLVDEEGNPIPLDEDQVLATVTIL